MATLLFFGAGASTPFGLPTMTEMVEKFEKKLKDENLKECYLYEEIKKKLSEGYPSSQIDIESIFSVITGIASEITPQKMGPFPFYYIKKFAREHNFTSTERDHAIQLNKYLEEFIKKECKFNGIEDELSKIYHESYEPFFANLWGISKSSKGKFTFPIGWKAYTTNYDLIFETFWSELYSIVDFFDSVNSNIPLFNRHKSVTVQSQTFVKLHGSLDWERLENGDVIKISPSSFTRLKKQGTAMLYPIQQKDLYLHPWITLFEEFKEGLRNYDTWYFVGYGFNDQYIFEIIIEALSNNISKGFIIINPRAKELKEKFPKELHEKIIILPIKFGGKYFAKDFEDFSQSKRTIEVELQTTAMRIELVFPCKLENTNIIKQENYDRGLGIDNSNSETCVGFHSKDNTQKKILFETKLLEFNKINENLELRLQLSESTTTHITIKNQGRIIDVFTISSFNHDTLDGKYKSSKKISLQDFYPK